jgi:N-methylhydantoinase A
MVAVGVDVGGTFTDFVAFDHTTGAVRLTKVPSTPRSPDRAVLNGLRKLHQTMGVDPATIDLFIHGTTVATNALIERKGVCAALVVTEGFRDVLHIGRQTRPRLYDFFARRPDPLIPRHLRYEVPERTLATGEVLRPLDEQAVHAVAQEIAAQGIEAVAVCLLHAYANPGHERRIRDLLQARVPGVQVVLSSDVLPEFKEYERMSTTVINAYVMPIVERYLRQIQVGLEALGVTVGLNVMQSNGGVMTAETASQKSVHTVLSGPAAGVIGAIHLARELGVTNLITMDMGGTSFDVSLVHEARPTYTVDSEIAGYPVRVPMIDIKTLGAGGGSIAWIDAGGALRVGPQSAGADPGPACYGLGGEDPTVTDANLVLGYLNPEGFAAGEMRLDLGRARAAVARRIATPLGLSVEEAAEGIVRVVNATMLRGIRLVSVERGFDPRQFALMCFGGAGPVHAVRLAQELGIPLVVVPESPGVACALGLLMADFRHDYSQTFLRRLTDLDPAQLDEAYAALEGRATRQMAAEGLAPEAIAFRRSADLRYAGQGYELEVTVPAGPYHASSLTALAEAFGRLHRQQYGYAMAPHTVEMVNLRLSAVGLRPKPALRAEVSGPPDPADACTGRRRIYMDGAFLDAPVYARARLRCGMRVDGPAIVEQADSTTVLPPGSWGLVDRYRNLLIHIGVS